jgi:hypothetical protein
MIPRTLFYCFGLSPDFGGKPFGLMHYACIISALERIRPDRCVVGFVHEPDTPWWHRLKPRIEPRHIEAPTEVFGNPLRHYAHQADVWRMRTLLREGGIYLDADVFVVRDFAPLLDNAMVLGLQQDALGEGLCNAVMLAAPGNPFLQRWYDSYRGFRSQGRDPFWDEHSVRIPRQLAADHPGEIRILPTAAFFTPNPSDAGIDRLFADPRPLDVPGAFAHHLWESNAWRPFIEGLTLSEVRQRDTAFHHLVRPWLADLPEGFGDPPEGPGGQAARRLRTRLVPVMRMLDRHAPRVAWRLRHRLLAPRVR